MKVDEINLMKTTLEKGGRNPPNETLDNIFNKLLVYIEGSPHLNKTNKNIEKKYNIKREHDDCWPEDDIKRAWGKTQRMDKTSLKRKRWSLAIMMQVIKRRQNVNESKGKEAQSDQSNVENVSRTCVEESVDGTPDPMKDTLRHKGSVPKNLLQSGNEKAHETQIKECANKPNSQNAYIRIPLSVMFKNESSSQGKVKSEAKDRPTYKLIDSIPFLREVRKNKSYVMLYNSQTRNATWVYEILNKSTLAGTQSRRRDLKFKDEPFEPLYEAANIEECDESEYEQGHLASAANHKWCQEAYEDTFILSNIAPQVPYLNQILWKELENHCQAKIKNSSDIRNVHVYSGPIYPQCDKRKKAERVKSWRKKIVPTHFFKVIIIEHENGTVELECYKMPNEKPGDKDKQSKDKNRHSKDKNRHSKDKNKQEKDKNKQEKDKNNQEKDKNKQEKDKNNQEKDKNVLENYRVSIEEIEAESGLTFTESSCIEGEVDITRKMKLVGGNGNEGSCSAEIKVTICTPLTNHNDFVYM